MNTTQLTEVHDAIHALIAAISCDPEWWLDDNSSGLIALDRLERAIDALECQTRERAEQDTYAAVMQGVEAAREPLFIEQVSA